MTLRSNGTGNPASRGAGRKTTPGEGARNEITVSELIEIVARRRLPLLACVALGALGAIVFSLLLPRRYEAVSRLTVDFRPTESASVEALAQVAGVADPTTLQTQVSILQTDSMAWEVIRRLRLDQRAEALPRRFETGAPFCQTPVGQLLESATTECRERLLEEFRTRVHVQAVPRTEIIEIRYRSTSPYLAAAVVNVIATAYMEYNFRAKYESATKSTAWLAGQLTGVRKDAEEAVRKMLALQQQTGTMGAEGGPNLLLAQLTGLSQQLIAAQGERIVQEARYRTALTGDPEAMVNLTQGTTLQLLHAQQAALENQYAELDAQFGENYPRVLQVKEQLAHAQEAMKNELQHTVEKLKREYEAAVRSEEMLADKVERQKQLVYSSTEAGEQAALLGRDVEATSELYKQIVKRLKTGGILAASEGPDITVVDPAAVPYRRAEPHPAFNLLAGIVVGLIAGLVLTGVLEALDPRIAAASAVRQICPVAGMDAIPCLAEGRRRAASAGSGILAVDRPDSAAADAFRILRTSLLHTRGGAQPKILLVSSPRPGDGGEVVSANLAAVLAQRSARVLLVDADLREGRLSETLGLHDAGGLSEALGAAGDTDLSQELPGLEMLRVLPAGSFAASPADLLDSERMRALVESWRNSYDHVVLSAPHLAGQSDAVILATMADTSLLAVRAGLGRQKDLRAAVDALDGVGAPLHGAVVTEPLTPSRFVRATSWTDRPSTRPGTETPHA
ncbi:MAG: GNVR domain-containing protein [Terracidiphilus sp.]